MIGDKEMQANIIAIESRDEGKLGAMSVGLFLKKIQEEITTRKGRGKE